MAVHVVLIVLHATFAVGTFVLGVVVIRTIPETVRSRGFIAYYACAFVAVGLLIAVVIVDWPGLSTVKQATFAFLGVLGIYMLWRTERARASIVGKAPRWKARFVGHVGFVLISLFDGFCIVSAIDLHLSPAVIVVVAVVGVAAGVFAIRLRVRRIALVDPTPAAPLAAEL